jgi:hypothetical protein
MALTYDYLGITNEVLEALNEVELTTATFSNTVGFHSYVKNKINAAIADIYNYEDTEWPFALTKVTQVVTVGFTGAVDGAIPEYTIDTTLASVDWDSFYTVRNDALTDGYQQPIQQLAWDNYRLNYREADANSETTDHSKPRNVSRRQDNKYILSPLSAYAYSVGYEGFAKPTYLSNATDVPGIPELYRQVIVDKVMQYAYMFRDNQEEADRAKDDFEKGVNRMRRVLIPQADTLRYID